MSSATSFCPHCGNAWGSKDHEEDCPGPTRPTRRRKAVPTGPVPNTTLAAEKGAELLQQLRERHNKT